ncbi:hypothetical protein M758_4G108300 [Ceratodon purpureus]|nr:hypothetical protein M758_4G108300 [Ceratodon purpureus]
MSYLTFWGVYLSGFGKIVFRRSVSSITCMAPGTWDGTLTAEEFERAALHLVSTWERCCPDLPQWTWQTSTKTVLSSTSDHACGYLVLQDIRVSSDQKDDMEEFQVCDDDDDGDDVEDHATMHVGALGVNEQHLYTYHVVYNESYRVPMLFLQGRLQDGRPLQWDSVLRDLPVGSQHVSDQSRWTFLTQEDHPLLHRPWFALHPCGTSEIMRLVFSDFFLQGKKDNVFVSEQLEVLSEISAVLEKQDTCESLPGKEKITISDRSVKQDNSEERFSSWIEKYVLTWMSFSCPAVGLAIPSRLYVETK